MLNGKTALVTGGSGAIGSAICRVLAGYGADIAFTFNRGEDAARQLSQTIRDLGRRTMSCSLSGTDSRAIHEFVTTVEHELGKVDILVNNLGSTQVLPFALIDEEDWDQAIAVNLKSMFLFTKAVVRGMVRRKQGVVLNLGSMAGHRLLEVPVHYATAKAGVTGFTLSLAKELCRYHIRVNEVAPGLIAGGIGNNVSERQLADYNAFCALGRPGTPEEVAELVAFLASDKASYINAQTVCADGGL